MYSKKNIWLLYRIHIRFDIKFCVSFFRVCVYFLLFIGYKQESVYWAYIFNREVNYLIITSPV